MKWVALVITQTLGGAQVNEPLLYLYGVGLDLDWENLWQYRTVHAQAAMAFMQDHYFEANGKDAYFSHPLTNERKLDVITAWVISVPISSMLFDQR